MRLLTMTLVKKEKGRSLLAALFLFVFLADAGSHAVICSNHTSKNEVFVSSSDSGHDDPCKAHMHCPDSQRNERQLPGFAHDSMQHNALFDGPVNLIPQIVAQSDSNIPYALTSDLFRPKSPPFHPPEIS